MEVLTMPQVFSIGSYLIYFWSNEGTPMEPVHIHVSTKRPVQNATKIWITRNQKCILCNNNSNIPEKILNNIMEIIETRSFEIISKWKEYFGENSLKFYC